MGIDEELLSVNNQTSADRVGNLNRARRNSISPNNFSGSLQSSNSDFYALRHAQRQRKMILAKKGGGAATVALSNPAQAASSKLLQQAWLNLIDSMGLTLIWINIHVFLTQILGEKLFRKLKLWEGMLLAALDIIVFIAIIMVLGFIYSIVTGQIAIVALKAIVGSLWKVLTGGK